MSYSLTVSDSVTFTITHARHMAAKVATDLKRMQRFYGQPTDIRIAEFEAELTALLKAGYLENVSYGFKLGDNYIEPTLRYTARELSGLSSADDDPGLIRPGAGTAGASFHSFLVYSQAYLNSSLAEREAVTGGLAIQRPSGQEPNVQGYLVADRTYSSGGRALNRSSVRSY